MTRAIYILIIVILLVTGWLLPLLLTALVIYAALWVGFRIMLGIHLTREWFFGKKTS